MLKSLKIIQTKKKALKIKITLIHVGYKSTFELTFYNVPIIKKEKNMAERISDWLVMFTD